MNLMEDLLLYSLEQSGLEKTGTCLTAGHHNTVLAAASRTCISFKDNQKYCSDNKTFQGS